MLKRGQSLRNRELREHTAVIDGKIKPTLILKNSTYLNTYTKQWLKAHIWIFNDHIIYVGDQLPDSLDAIEVVDCVGNYLVPGYIEQHAHPFQLHDPEELAYHAAKFGTTTLINDNLFLTFLSDKKKAFSLMADMNKLPVSMYWRARYDSQTALKDEESYFNTNEVLAWISHDSVVQGGELTAGQRLLEGDDRLLHWIQETKRLGKPVEGQLKGASEALLTKMKLLGINADHESMNGADVIKRLQLGYSVALRHSEMGPSLGGIIAEILAEKINVFDQLTMMTDGSSPMFTEKGLLNRCIEIAIHEGVPVEDAYCMATKNVARYYGLDEQIGSIAPGMLAHINILQAKDDPHPVGVLAKGKWILKEGIAQPNIRKIDWKGYGIGPLTFDWDLQMMDLQFSLPLGLKMIDDVIMKPAVVQIDGAIDELEEGTEDAFLLLMDKSGKWLVNSIIQGFTNQLGGLISSYSATGDIVLIGKNKQDMLIAWKRLKELGGGIVLAHQGEIIYELPLGNAGMMFQGDMTELIEKERIFKQLMIEYGYRFNDPLHSIYSLSATNLPYIRVTQQGVYNARNGSAFFPANMR